METQQDITPQMRAILVDWLVEVQECFELYHETLYLGVKLLDHFLERNTIKRDELQLVGATTLLISSKIEVKILYFFYLDNILNPAFALRAQTSHRESSCCLHSLF